MEALDRFSQYATDFEKTYKDDSWERLEPHFHKNVVYEVCNMPFHCRLSGREAVLNGIRKSLDGFDRRCQRTLQPPTVMKVEGNKVLINADVRYSRGGSEVTSTLWEVVTIEDGRILHLMDLYSPGDDQRYLRWIAASQGDLDASYV
ncbi:MAG: nuclear transport factor 2 family protein [Pseudomonadota bacterium]